MQDDVRASALLRPQDVAVLVGMPTATVYSWMRPGADRDPVVHSSPQGVRGWPSISLFGLAEAHAVRALRRMHWPMRDVTRYATFLRDQSADRFALASPKLVTDGIDTFEEHVGGELTRIRDGQIPISEIIRPLLWELVPWRDGRTGGYRPPTLKSELVEIDPRFNAGRMSFVRTRMPLFAPVGSLIGGDSRGEVINDYGLNDDEISLIDEHFDWLATAA